MLPEPRYTVTLRMSQSMAEKIDEIAARDDLRFVQCIIRLLGEAIVAREGQEETP